MKCELLSSEKNGVMHLFSYSSHCAGNWHSQVLMLLWPSGTQRQLRNWSRSGRLTLQDWVFLLMLR